jgi:hypothetical protein
MANENLGVWEGFKNSVRHHLNTDNINNFHNWPVLQQTMIAGIDAVEFTHLQNSPLWSKWMETLNETALQPNSYNPFPSSSTNNMHHAYSLDVMMSLLGLNLNEFGTIVEFGGGYGNTARLFKRWGHTGDFYIYDIPELLEIQRHYLTVNNAPEIKLISGAEALGEIGKNSLFLGLWSISEVPIEARAALLDQLKFYECENIFIAMGETFYQENNMAWLQEVVIPKLGPKYAHEFVRIAHGQGMYYFRAKKTD